MWTIGAIVKIGESSRKSDFVEGLHIHDGDKTNTEEVRKSLQRENKARP